VVIGQLSALDAAIALEFGIVLVAMGFPRNAVLEIHDQSAMGMAGPAHHMFLTGKRFADHISLHMLNLAGADHCFLQFNRSINPLLIQAISQAKGSCHWPY
jgi:hypothetical protein